MKPLIVLPAAGASSRMGGRDKLLEPVDGTPLLRRQCLAALATGCPTAVTLPPNSPRADVLRDLAFTRATVPDAAEGIAASLRTAVSLLKPDQPLMILLPDVPGIGTDEINAILTAYSGTPIRGAAKGSNAPGTPLLLPHSIASKFATLTGDNGGRSILRDHAVTLHRFADDRATRDLDTPEDWAKWRSEHQE